MNFKPPAISPAHHHHPRRGRTPLGLILFELGVVAITLSGMLSSAAETPRGLLARAREAYQDGRIDDAVVLADQAVEAAALSGDADAARARFTRGVIYEAAGRRDDALADYTYALKAFPNMSELYNRRGSLHFKMGRIEESVRDFDRAVELDPASDPYHWQRGISYYYAGRFSACISQFERHRTVNPDDVENAFWHFLCKAAQEGVSAAREALLPVGPDSRIPMMTVYALLRGEAEAGDVMADVERVTGSTDRDNALFYAHLYVGLYYEAVGKPDAAKFHITKAAREFPSQHYMGDVARVHAARHGGDP